MSRMAEGGRGAPGSDVQANSTKAEKDAVAARLASMLECYFDELIYQWLNPAADGPTRGSSEAGSPDYARKRYLIPLGRMLLGALRGSQEHLAVYLDERLRYVHGTADIDSMRTSLRHEIDQVSSVAHDRDPEIPYADAVSVLTDLHGPILTAAVDETRLLLIGDCVHVETRAFLVPSMRRVDRPVNVQQTFFSTRQPLESVNTAIVQQIKQFDPHVIGVSLFTFEGVPPYTRAWQAAGIPGRGRRALTVVPSLVELVRQLVDDVRSTTDAPVIIHAPAGLPLDKIRRRLLMLSPHSRWQRRLLNDLGQGLASLVEGTENTLLLDERVVVAAGGPIRGINRPVFEESDVPPGYAHPTKLGPLLARHYHSVLDDYALLSSAKAVLVDFDNTLWDGVMAEGPVVHHLERQRLLKDLKNAGILLVALSKNSPESIRWSELALSPEDFVLQKINWTAKPDNVAAAIAELDLAPKAFVLVDDSPVERALVTEQIHGVKALDALLPSTWVSLRRWIEFPSTRQTEESQRRTTMYREAAERRREIGEIRDYPSMMTSLKLRYLVRPAGTSDFERLSELIQRTNQFNTTTIRLTGEEIRGLVDDPNKMVLVASLSDRFGDLGTVAVSIVDLPNRHIEGLIMSCRAMGFDLEIALLADTISAMAAGAGPVSAAFVQTPRNGPASTVYARAGFHEREPGLWVLDSVENGPAVPSWLHAIAP